jgi:ABC-type antimicrobial peptide transport system permease subunit
MSDEVISGPSGAGSAAGLAKKYFILKIIAGLPITGFGGIDVHVVWQTIMRALSGGANAVPLFCFRHVFCYQLSQTVGWVERSETHHLTESG